MRHSRTKKWLPVFTLGAGLILSPTEATVLTHYKTYSDVDVATAVAGGLREVAAGGTITVTGVSGQILEAYLYWHGHGLIDDEGQATCSAIFNNQAITGQSIGVSNPDGWDKPDHNLDFTFGQAFRADVTTLITGNGDYTIRGFALPLTPDWNQVQGASLVIIFDDGNPANNVDVAIYNGCDENSLKTTYDPAGWYLNISGVQYAQGDSVQLELHVSDGQWFYNERPLFLNSQLLFGEDDADGSDIFSGSAPGPLEFDYTFYKGSLWDARSFEIGPFLVDGIANNLTLTTGYIDENISLILTLIKTKVGGLQPVQIPPGNVAPTVTCPDAVTVDCAPANGATHTLTVQVGDANGDSLQVTWIVNGSVARKDTVPAGGPPTSAALSLTYTFPQGNNVVAVTVSDPYVGPTTCNTVVTVTAIDALPPSVDCGPGLQALANNAGNAAIPNILNQVTASDNCAAANALIYSQTPSPGTLVGVGTHTITVTVTDSAGNVGQCSTTFTVTQEAPPPPSGDTLTANPDAAATCPGVPVTTGNVLSNDSSSNGNPFSISVFDAYSAQGGSIAYNGNGTFTYSPPASFSGTDSFTYTISNASAAAVGTVTINVAVAPVAGNDSAVAQANSSQTIAILTNDSDPGGGTLTVVQVTQPSNGSATLNLDGTITYTPTANFNGTDSFNYTISNGSCTTTGVVTLTVVSPAPSEGFATFTQGGWGSTPNGTNPGSLLADNFAAVYPNGVTIGGTYTLKFTSAQSIEVFLPQGGTASVLKSSQVNPKKKVSVLAGQVLALELNVKFSSLGITQSGLGNLKLARGKLAGSTVTALLTLGNKVLGGQISALPNGVRVSDLNDIITAVNENYCDGTTDNGYLIP
jgi:hypothetical protein